MKKVFPNYFLLVVTVSFFCCSSSPNNKDKNRLNVNHEIKYTKQGTRSEVRSGYLAIDGHTLPDVFETVVAEDIIYIFKSRSTLWGSEGYFPQSDIAIDSVFPPTNKCLSESDLARGWSEVAGRPRNMPYNWIFVKWVGGSAVLSSSKLNDFVSFKALKSLPRYLVIDKSGHYKRLTP